jgi:hypothetical protein
MYKELQWRFSKVQSYSDVFQIAKNCDGTYPINPKLAKVPVRCNGLIKIYYVKHDDRWLPI